MLFDSLGFRRLGWEAGLGSWGVEPIPNTTKYKPIQTNTALEPPRGEAAAAANDNITHVKATISPEQTHFTTKMNSFQSGGSISQGK